MSGRTKRRLLIAVVVAHVLDDLVYAGLAGLALWGVM